MNRGEWGEPYAALRLLGYKKLYIADEDGNLNLKEWLDVLRILRKETEDRVVSYRVKDGNDIEISVNDVPATVMLPCRFPRRPRRMSVW